MSPMSYYILQVSDFKVSVLQLLYQHHSRYIGSLHYFHPHWDIDTYQASSLETGIYHLPVCTLPICTICIHRMAIYCTVVLSFWTLGIILVIDSCPSALLPRFFVFFEDNNTIGPTESLLSPSLSLPHSLLFVCIALHNLLQAYLALILRWCIPISHITFGSHLDH